MRGGACIQEDYEGGACSPDSEDSMRGGSGACCLRGG